MYLTSVGASLTVLAGCNELASDDTRVTDEPETTPATETTATTNPPPLSVATAAPTDVTYESAILRGSVSGGGEASVRTLFQWRQSGGDWRTIESGTRGQFRAELDGLQSDTSYDYRAVAVGDERVRGEIRSFTTPRNIITYDGGGVEAFRAALTEAAERPGATIQIESGTYTFDPLTEYDVERPPGPHVFGTDLEDVTIAGNGATIEFAEARMGGFHLFDSTGLTLRNLTFDYASLPFTQGRITDLGASKREFVVELDDGYPSLAAPRFGQGEVFASLHQADGSFIQGIKANGLPIKLFESMERLNDRRWRLTLSEPSTTRGLAEGRRIAITARDPPGSAQALKFSNLDQPRVENVTVNASPSFAVLFANCQSPVVNGLRVGPPENSDRLIGSDADGIHVLNNRGGPTITDCSVERLLDDGLIVSSLMAPIERVDGATVHLDPIGVFAPQPGDTLAAMTPTGIRRNELPAIDSIEREYDAPRGVSPAQRITFASSVADTTEAGDYLTNSATANRGFEVRGNSVSDNRANAIRISGGPGEIVGNEFHGTQNQTINVLCDTSGTYAPERWTNDVVIADNSIRDSGKSYLGGGQPAGVFMTHSPAEGIKPEGRPHRNIEIRNNSFRDLGFRAGILANVRGLTVSGNEVTGVNELDYRYGREAFLLRTASDVTFEGNSVSATSQYVDHFGRRIETEDLDTDGNSFQLDGQSLSPTFE